MDSVGFTLGPVPARPRLAVGRLCPVLGLNTYLSYSFSLTT